MALTRTSEGKPVREWTVDDVYTVCLSLATMCRASPGPGTKRLRQVSQTGTRKSPSSRLLGEQLVPHLFQRSSLITKVMIMLVR